MLWLGERHGYLSDWTTQLWVKMTGRRVNLARNDWLSGPSGRTRGIGSSYFSELAQERGLQVLSADQPTGLVRSINDLLGPDFNPDGVDRQVADFYEHTSAYELDAWSEWSGTIRPFGWLLAILFSRRLQQLNVPLSPLDTAQGMTSQVFHLVDPATQTVVYTAWLRELLETGNVLYAGTYSVCCIPGSTGPCLKVVFPLPNGNAIVLMKPESAGDGSLALVSRGEGFGDPGFYFVVHGTDGFAWARYVRALRETIRVYAGAHGEARADHVLSLWGVTFLRLHYRLRRQLK